MYFYLVQQNIPHCVVVTALVLDEGSVPSVPRMSGAVLKGTAKDTNL